MTLGGLGNLAMMPISHAVTPLFGLSDITFDETRGTQFLENGGLYQSPDMLSAQMIYGGALSTIGLVLNGIHGWQRTGHLGWAFGWSLLGSIFPIPTTFYALGQGFGKKKGRR
jgi:hypothetical protein